MRTIVTTIAILAIAGPGFAQATRPKAKPESAPAAASSPCGRFADQVEDALKDLGQIHADDFLEDSAPRTTMRAAQSTSLLLEIQINTTLASENHCPARTRPVALETYDSEGTICRAALGKGKDAIDAACDQSKWKPLPY